MFDKIKKWLQKNSVQTDDGPVLDNKVKVWGVVSGPYHRDDVDDPNVPDGLEYMLVCQVEVDGEVTVSEYWFSSFEDSQVWVKHFQSKLEPIEVNYG